MKFNARPTVFVVLGSRCDHLPGEQYYTFQVQTGRELRPFFTWQETNIQKAAFNLHCIRPISNLMKLPRYSRYRFNPLRTLSPFSSLTLLPVVTVPAFHTSHARSLRRRSHTRWPLVVRLILLTVRIGIRVRREDRVRRRLGQGGHWTIRSCSWDRWRPMTRCNWLRRLLTVVIRQL